MSASPPPQKIRRRWGERLIEQWLWLCAVISIVVTLAIIVVLFNETVYAFFGDTAASARRAEAAIEAGEPQEGRFGAFFQTVSVGEFFTETRWTPGYPTEEGKRFGIAPLIFGTLLVTLIAAAIGLPIGLLSAIYLSEYAGPRLRGIVKPVLEVLAGIPTVVYGFFALVFVTPYVLRPIFEGLFGLEVEAQNALSAGIIVGIMIIPMVSSLSEDALRAVPQSLREAGYALGSTKLRVSLGVVVPAALSGIIASFLLALARAIGETMAVTIAAGLRPQITLNPLTEVQTMTCFIASMASTDNEVGTIEYNSLYAVAFCLFLITLTMNVISHLVTARFREVYQ